MPKKKTLQEIKDFLFEKYGDDIEVLSTEYENSKEPLLVRCKCGRTYWRTFNKLRSGFITCKKCRYDGLSELYRTPFDKVLQTLQDNECDYISGEYINGSSKLVVKCSCGNIFERSYAKIISGQNKCLECSKQKIIEAKTKYTAEEAYDLFNQHGFVCIGPYKNAYTKVECICRNCHRCDLILSEILMKPYGKGCKQCSLDSAKSNNSTLYKGGTSKISYGIRQSLYKWRDHIRELYNDTCPITGKQSDDCVVHHLISLDTIYKKVLKEMGIITDIKMSESVNSFPDYTIYDQLKQNIVLLHNTENIKGILIAKEIHIEFHKKYGRGNNTPEQFDEFLKETYAIPLSSIIK